jgi:hypothetical protein
MILLPTVGAGFAVGQRGGCFGCYLFFVAAYGIGYVVARARSEQTFAMLTAANDNKIVTTARKIHVLYTMLEKMQAALRHAEGRRRRKLLRLIGVGHRRLAELRRTYKVRDERQ